MEAKEIARELEIEFTTVKQHLKSARQRLHVGRSIEAARILAEHEARSPPPPGSTPPSTIPDRDYLGLSSPRQHDVDRELNTVRDGGGIDHPAATEPPWWLPLPYATRGRPRNDLSITARLAAAAILLILLVAAVGFFVQAMQGLS